MSTVPNPTLQLVPFGAVATDALAVAVDRAKGGDPMAAVTVVVPSALAGVTLRRRLAAAGGLVNVRFVTLPRLCEHLALPALARAGTPPMPGIVAGALVRAVLAAGPGSFAGVADAAATEDSLLATFAELSELSERHLEVLAAQSTRARDVVRLFRAYRAEARRWADSYATLAAARRAVARHEPVAAELGAVILYLPRRLRSAESALLGELAQVRRLSAIVGLTGDPDADGTADGLVAALTPLLGPATAPAVAPAVPHGSFVVRAPDPAEEVAVAVRMVVGWLEEGIAPERIGLTYRSCDPYALMLTEQLGAVGVGHHGPGSATLAQTAAGRGLVGLLALSDHDFRRTDVMRLLRAVPMLAPGAGRTPTARWARLAREAGVAAGSDHWRQRLATARAALVEHQRRRPARDDDSDRDRDRDRLAEYDRLGDFIAGLTADTDVGEARGWAVTASWARGLLITYLGTDREVATWPVAEREARQAVFAVLDQIAGLDGVTWPSRAESPPERGVGPALFRRVLGQELARPVGTIGRFGHGVAVAPIADLVGADLDRLAVLGMTEGAFPPRGRHDAVVLDREWRATGAPARWRVPSRAEEHRHYLGAVASAPERVLTFAGADPRGQRERQPARWLLDTCAHLAGRPFYTGDLAALGRSPSRPLPAPAGWFTHADSFEWWLANDASPASACEADLAELLMARRDNRPVTATAAVAVDPRLARGLEAAAARRGREFGIWAGNVGEHRALSDDLAHPRSATSLEDWATCPRRYFLGHVLGLRPVADPTESEVVGPLDRGQLVHAVLEQFLAEHLGRPPGLAWSPADKRRLCDLARAHFDQLEAQGRTGRPLLWRLERQRLQGIFEHVLDHDDVHRRERDLVPVAVEHGFGLDSAPAVGADAGTGPGVSPRAEPAAVAGVIEVAADNGTTVRFRGRIDRVDRSTDGRRLAVLDYKTGRVGNHRRLASGHADRDVTANGTRLQLAVYAHAAAAAYGPADVDASYWFVGHGGVEEVGFRLDDEADARFREVVGVVAQGVAGGLFPARPGKETWRWGRLAHENCTYCPFDRICPTTRGDDWAELRRRPELAAYIALAEPAGRDERP